MKTLAASLAILVLASSPVFAFGAHNPTLIDNPDVPNCTLIGPNSYANNPSCETVVVVANGGASMATVVGAEEECMRPAFVVFAEPVDPGCNWS